MKKTRNNNRLDAFTLTELLVVLVIIGILVLIALPNMSSTVNDARATEAQINLNHLYEKQETYRMAKLRYASNIEELGFEQPVLIDAGGNAFYQYSIVDAGDNSFKAQAKASKDFDGDGQFNLWEIDNAKQLKEVVPD